MDIRYISKCLLHNKSIFYNELQVKHLKSIYKCLLGDELIPDLIFKNLNNILIAISDLTKKEISNLNVLEYFLLLLDIRCTSIGNLIFVELADKSDTKIEINVYNFINILNEINIDELLQSEIQDNIIINYTLPTITDLLNFTNKKTLDDIYPYFIKTIDINKTEIDLKKISTTERNSILEKIPAKITSLIIKKVQNIIHFFNDINLLSRTNGLQDKVLLFNFNIANLTALIKILFGEQLLNLYENIFALCKVGNFSPEYIENCTPGEYLLFVKKLEALKQQTQNTNNDMFVPEEYDPMSGNL